MSKGQEGGRRRQPPPIVPEPRRLIPVSAARTEQKRDVTDDHLNAPASELMDQDHTQQDVPPLQNPAPPAVVLEQDLQMHDIPLLQQIDKNPWDPLASGVPFLENFAAKKHQPIHDGYAPFANATHAMCNLAFGALGISSDNRMDIPPQIFLT